ncbi:MAG TPA: hypothetical protein EYQ50_15775 [Verrucomicrobiales bacterium]|nr:hypothetical protein [Verrucomicrobiales bacterium]HIL70385.1 hypothetical protein [Verrucomicrobiota bacterium]
MRIQAEIEDPTHLKLKQPLDAEVGSVIVLEILGTSDRDEFLTGSSSLLERAYGDDEPDYSEAGTAIKVS